MAEADCPTRVFISYSHDSLEHKKRVLELAQQLRAHGLHTELDQFLNGSPPAGWARWMQAQLSEATFVLVVCTPTYLRRFDGTEMPGQGDGSTWEGILARQELYQAHAVTRKYIPITFDGDQSCIPAPLRQFNVYRVMDQYPELLRVLLDRPAVMAGPVAVPLPIAGASDSPAGFSYLLGLPLPLSQTLLRSLNAKTPEDAYHSARHFCLSLMQLSAVSHAAYIFT